MGAERKRVAFVAACVATLVASVGAALAADPTAGAVKPGVFAGDVRALPTVEPWAPGMPEKEGPPRRLTHPEAALVVPAPRTERDPLLDLGGQGATRKLRVYSPPELNFDAQGYSGVSPPDTCGDIGSTYYIQTINGANGATVVIHDKTTGAVVSGPFLLSALWTAGGACAVGAGDAIVLYDQLASRWLLAEFTDTGNDMCVYVSRNADPIAGGWLNYDFVAPNFPDYLKFGVWSDGYYVTTNEPGDSPVYALDRSKMLAGQAATMQRFTAPSLAGFGFQALTPVDIDGSTPPPPGSPAFFVRHVDDEVHGAPVGASDQLEVWQLAVDFATPANSVFSLAASIPVAEFDSELCGGDLECVPQPAGIGLDPVREVVMWRAQYRNFGAFQTLVGNFAVDASGTDDVGIRWFELQRVGAGAWSLFQEGTYAPDAKSRWMGSIAMDGSGNMALGFSISDSISVYPSMRYTGRLLGSTAGVMDQAEVNVAPGLSAQGNERWGDYSSMNVDPVDDCTFWFTSEYMQTGGDWQTRVTRFRYDAPTCVNAVAPVCGDNVKQVGEDCDGVDASFCPGLCTGGCTCPTPSCGNDSIEVGEQCDGTSLGACSACRPDCKCELCGAAPEPSANCFLQFVPEKASISVTDKADDAKDLLQWNWNKGAATTLADYPNPLTSGSWSRYEICVYDGSGAPQPLKTGAVDSGGTCGTKPCWKQIGSKTNPIGFKYNNRSGNADGLTQLQVKAGADGKSQVIVKGKGVNLAPPNPTLTPPVTVQMIANDGTSTRCWQTVFSSSTKNTDEQFKAKGP